MSIRQTPAPERNSGPLSPFVCPDLLHHIWVSSLYWIEVWQINKHKDATPFQATSRSSDSIMPKTKELQYFGNDGDQYTQVDPGHLIRKSFLPTTPPKLIFTAQKRQKERWEPSAEINKQRYTSQTSRDKSCRDLHQRRKSPRLHLQAAADDATRNSPEAQKQLRSPEILRLMSQSGNKKERHFLNFNIQPWTFTVFLSPLWSRKALIKGRDSSMKNLNIFPVIWHLHIAFPPSPSETLLRMYPFVKCQSQLRQTALPETAQTPSDRRGRCLYLRAAECSRQGRKVKWSQVRTVQQE